MKTGVCVLVVVVLLFSSVCGAGCMSEKSPVAPLTPLPTAPAAPQPAPSPATLPTAPPAPAAVPATTGTITASGIFPVPVVTPEPDYYSAADVPDNPWIENLVFTKSYYPFTVPGCAMNVLFPEVAQDPGYGILQPVPELVAFSPDRMTALTQAYVNGDTNPAIVAGCAAAPAGTGWNFIKISGVIMPRNARPADYDITVNVSSRGRIISHFRINETLTIEQPFSFERYIPLKSNEMYLFDSIEPVFHKMT